MKTLSGLVVRPGIVIGPARKIQPVTWQIARRSISPEETAAELARLDAALAEAYAAMELQLDLFLGSDSDKEILRTHQLILRDPELLARLREAIATGLESAAWAVQSTFAAVEGQFAALKNDYYAQRAADYRDVGHRLLTELAGEPAAPIAGWEPGQIAVLREATPSQITLFAAHGVPAYCAELGSYTSHSAILTRSVDITAIVAVANLFDSVSDGDELILDGIQGKVIIAPDAPTSELYAQLRLKYLDESQELQKQANLPARTLSGRQIKLRCNLELLPELDALKRLGAAGIGLYRTEFLYLGKDALPTEQQQFEAYREVAAKAAPHSVTIRTFDLGGDKLSHLIPSAREDNPYLGLRGIRFSLRHREIFRLQLRAVLRASAFGKIKLMFPMVSDLQDFIQAREATRECMKELDSEGILYDRELQLGVMIEVPSAALCANELASHCDFFSIGTNDLVQYTLAADRNNSTLADYYVAHHPAVLQLIRLTLKAGRKHRVPVSVCGEMASLPEYVPLLIGLGFTELSVNPGAFSRCKSVIRRCDSALDRQVRNFDFRCSLAEAEEFIHRLKPYYQP